MRLSAAILCMTLGLSAAAGDPSTSALAAAGIDPTETRLNYMLNCQGCHAADGRGLNDIPAMADSVGTFLRVDGGRAYLVQVPGSTNSPLSNQDLADVLNWILLTMSAEQLPRPFTPYSAKKVGGFRAQPLIDAAATRALLLRQLAQQ